MIFTLIVIEKWWMAIEEKEIRGYNAQFSQ